MPKLNPAGKHSAQGAKVPWRFLHIVVIAALLGAGCRHLAAQLPTIDGYVLKRPVLDDKEVRYLAEALHLTAWQRTFIEDLLDAEKAWQEDAYAEAVRRSKAINEFRARVQERIDQARESHSYDQMGQTTEEVRTFEDYHTWHEGIKAEAVRRSSSALNEIEGVLDDRQRAIWADYLCDRRRSRTLAPGAHFAAERVDLKDLFGEKLRLLPAEMDLIATVLSDYSRAIDPVLVRRNNTIRLENTLPRPHEGPEMDRLNDLLRKDQISIDDYSAQVRALAIKRRDEELKRWEPLYADHKAIRDMTLNYFDSCIRLLPPERIEPAQRAFEREAYPEITRDLPLDDVMDRVLEMDALSDDQRWAVQNIRDSQWIPARHAIDVRLMRLKDRDDEQWKEKRRNAGDPTIEARRTELLHQRNAIQKLNLDRVRDTLTQALRATIKWPTLETQPNPGLPGPQPDH